MATNDGGPAIVTGGMSLRDWFAGLAMQSLIVIGARRVWENPDCKGGFYEEPQSAWYFGEDPTEMDDTSGGQTLSGDAYSIADAMLARREKANG